jgi:23S rRNA (adenine2503-C2)-methyltransferase
MTDIQKTDIRSVTPEELESFFISTGEKSFRGRQVYEWLWKKGCSSFDDMTTLPVTLRNCLQDHYTLKKFSLQELQQSTDGTLKYLFLLSDGLHIESVLIPAGERTTACVSSQVGCALGCLFCATGQSGFRRNLTVAEIYDQIWFLDQRSREQYKIPLSNVVFMGMGEPLMNYRNVVETINMVTSSEGMGMSPQRITISSVGIPEKIRQLADDNVRAYFALSLHSANPRKRDQIVPINRKYPIDDLTGSLVYFNQKTGKRITIEYLLLASVNDTLEDARELAAFCRNFPVKINLIDFNPTGAGAFGRSQAQKVKAFAGFLESRNMIVTHRRSRGKDIDAACGQLALKVQKNEPINT